MNDTPTIDHGSEDCWAHVGLVVVLMVAVAVYARTTSFPFLDWDDLRFIVDNPLVNDSEVPLVDRFLTPTTGYLAPVTLNLQAAMWALSSGAPWLFHLVSTLVHLANITLVFFLARKLGASASAGLVAAGVFGLHPIVIEPVSWATGLKDLLTLSGALVASLLFVTGRLKTAAAVLLVAALSKPTGATVGLAWLAGALWFSFRPAPGAQLWANQRGIAAACVAALVGILVLGLGAFQHNVSLIEDTVDTTGWLFQPAMAAGYHVHHLIWPTELHPMYLLDRTVGLSDPHTWVGLVAFALCAAGLFFARHCPGVFLPLLVAGVMYAPVSNVAPFPRFLADSYAYAPLAFLLIAYSVAAGRVRAPRWVLIAPLTVVCVLAAMSAMQVERWSGNAELWGPVAAVDDRWAQPWLLLAQGFASDGELESAGTAYEQFRARTDSTRYLASHAQLLERAMDLVDAECLMAHLVRLPESSLGDRHNLALFLMRHPEISVQFGREARTSLRWAQATREAGLLRWPEALQAGIAGRLESLATTGDALPSCEGLSALPRTLANVFPTLAP